jgi:hypothetical protein
LTPDEIQDLPSNKRWKKEKIGITKL